MSQILIMGPPNSGKSLLFNRLTGLNHKVSNFPGVTVDVSRGKPKDHSEGVLVDFPGIYSLTPISGEEEIAVKKFKEALATQDDLVIFCLIDGTRLERSISFALQILQEAQRHNKRVVLLLNMVDELRKYQVELDYKKLGERLGCPVLPVSGKTGEGFEELQAYIKGGVMAPAMDQPSLLEASSEDLQARAHKIAKEFVPKTDLLIKSQSRLDRYFLNSIFGGLSFFLIMFVLFQSIFTWAAPVMDGVEALVAWMGEQALAVLPGGVVADFTRDALFGGLGAFLVFVPQIFVLTFVVGLLEDSGYLARATVICHRPLRFFGLTGKSFVPLLSGVACAIPGLYAARTIDSPFKRWLTYFAIPLMPCSARLPVYTLLIAAFIPAQTGLFGLVGYQGLAMFGVYLFGILTALIVTALLSRSRVRKDDTPFVLEMPPYRMPGWLPILRNSWNRSRLFVTKAGMVIFLTTVVVWALGYFPNLGEDLESSWMGTIGKGIEWMFEPLGLDWKYGVAIMASFLAREVFVGTLGVLFGIEAAEENIAGLTTRIQESGLSLASGVALLVFYAIAMQCVSTLAVLRRESGSWKLPGQIFLAYSILAYVMALVAFQLVGLFS